MEINWRVLTFLVESVLWLLVLIIRAWIKVQILVIVWEQLPIWLGWIVALALWKGVNFVSVDLYHWIRQGILGTSLD